MRLLTWIAIVFAAALFASTGQGLTASVVAKVDVSSQTMTVSKNGRVIYRWKVSTARSGYWTPRGTYSPKRLHRMWYSRKYDMSPMPYSDDVPFRSCHAVPKIIRY